MEPPVANERREDRPWERPGAVRRDCEPHRGGWLLALGCASMMLGMASVALAFPGLVGLPLGLAVCLLARRDLREMAAGRMDPAGMGRTERARGIAAVGVVASALGPLVFAAVVMLPRR